MISVVIPVYKVEPYLEKCIKSVIDQTFTDWELILVDDGSPDRCGEICDSFALQDARIRVIHQENGGLSAARNAGMKSVSGDFVTFIDSDDFITPEYLDLLWNSIRENNSEIAVSGYREMNETDSDFLNRTEGIAPFVCSGKEACRRLMEQEETFMITAWGKLYSRKLFPLICYPESCLNEDEYVNYRLFYESDCVSFTGADSYVYLKRSGSITSGITSRHLQAVDAFREAIDFFKGKNESALRVIAEKRLLRMIRTLYLKSRNLTNTERNSLYADWKKAYQEYRFDIAGISSAAERLSNRIFNISPSMYSLLRSMMH